MRYLSAEVLLSVALVYLAFGIEYCTAVLCVQQAGSIVCYLLVGKAEALPAACVYLGLCGLDIRVLQQYLGGYLGTVYRSKRDISRCGDCQRFLALLRQLGKQRLCLVRDIGLVIRLIYDNRFAIALVPFLCLPQRYIFFLTWQSILQIFSRFYSIGGNVYRRCRHIGYRLVLNVISTVLIHIFYSSLNRGFTIGSGIANFVAYFELSRCGVLWCFWFECYSLDIELCHGGIVVHLSGQLGGFGQVAQTIVERFEVGAYLVAELLYHALGKVSKLACAFLYMIARHNKTVRQHLGV